MTGLSIYAEQIRRLGSMTTAERAQALRDMIERVRALWAHLGQVHGGRLRKVLAAHLATVPSQGETRTTIPRRLSGVALVKWAEAKDRDQSWLDAVVSALPAEDGDEARRQLGAIAAAREAFVTHNLALVVFFASRAETGMELPDRIQAGNLGLLRAVRMYRPMRGTLFATYARHWIRAAMQRDSRDKRRLIRVPSHACETVCKAAALRAEAVGLSGEEPEHNAVARTLRIKPALLAHYQRMTSLQPTSLDQPLTGGASTAGGDERTWADFLAADEVDPCEQIDEAARRQALHAALGKLDPQEQEIIRLRYGLSDGKAMLLREVGERVGGVSRERIRQREKEALRKLRRHLKKRI